MNRPIGVPAAEYTKLAEIILRFADAVEDVLSSELTFPFSVGSEGLRDCAADGQHRGTRTKRPLTNLAMSQVHAVGAQCDFLHGIAAVLPAPKAMFAPYPLARTCVATAAKAWFILGGASLEERLQRYLNEELEALYRTSWAFEDPESLADINALTEDHVAVGATAGLRVLRKNNPNDWDAPYLVRFDQGRRDTPPSETVVVRELFTAAGLEADQVGRPYQVLSAPTHGRIRQSGVSESIRTGRSVYGVQMRAMHSSAGTTAKVTVLAAIATQTHLRALARYADVSEEVVQDRLGDPLAEWSAMGGVPVPA